MLLLVLTFAFAIVVFAYIFSRFMGTTDTFDLASIMREMKLFSTEHEKGAKDKKAKGATMR